MRCLQAKTFRDLGTLAADLALGSAFAVVEHSGVRRFTTSYAELAEAARRVAAELERRGIGAGERLVL